jgi:hypothetical protein
VNNNRQGSILTVVHSSSLTGSNKNWPQNLLNGLTLLEWKLIIEWKLGDEYFLSPEV